MGEEEGARSKGEEADSAESQEGAPNLGRRRRRPTHNGSDSVTQKGPKPRGPGF